MPSCLGIQIEKDVIKYAKVLKEKDSIKVEAFNIVFYEDLKKTIDRIIEETNSYKTPITLNLSEEKFDYFQIPALLAKNDMKNAAQLEFDMLCEENKYNKSVLETRFLYTTSVDNPEMMQATAISANQADLAQKTLNFQGYKVGLISSMPVAISNLISESEKNNIAIVNIENETQITMMAKGEVVKFDKIKEGMQDILEKINATENSIQKSYEVCKNTTIYVQDNGENLSEGNEHIELIMPTLYSLVTKVKESIEWSGFSFSKIYITGLGTAINNIDLYFQEYFDSAKCEILKPFFADTTSIKTSVKDYIEVNSAIALALDGLGYGYKEVNFLPGKMPNQGKKTGGKKSNIPKSSTSKKRISKFALNREKLQPIESMLLRVCFTIFIAIIGYLICTSFINKSIQEKNTEIDVAIKKVESEVRNVELDIKKVEASTREYESIIGELNALKESQFSTRTIKKLAIPNLMYQLTRITPKYVRIISLENTEGTHIVIEAESKHYEQLGFLYAAISTNNYLTNLKSTSGTKSGDIVKVTIEGDLP